MTMLSDIVGQERAIDALRRAVSSGRLHHAWLFHGPMGVGKRTTAEAFAALLLDPTTAPNLAGVHEPDPDSPTQRLIASGAHPDLRLVTKELATFSREESVRRQKQRVIGVEVVREFLVEPATTAAMTGQGERRALASKVFIVDEAHLLSREAANAALKILEEPPPGVVFILITDQGSALLPTIRSRCQSVPFGSLDDAAMASWLERAAPDLRGAGRKWTLAFADGSPGRAAIAIEGNLSTWSERLDPMLADLLAGRFPDGMGGAMEGLIKEWAEAAVAGKPNASKDAANKAGADLVFDVLLTWARARLRAETSRPDAALSAIDLIDETQRHVDDNANRALALENLVAQLARR